ncbi:hypothetical protein [Streptomyces morookaense]|uniref:Uncharacterized protein n=1 Tax=Streptomyces morookaense TaxID=1970 RepID=A0A7Y7B266_STRMO|nr:hypothetical protein [Streptomyces morookaense]NVK77660.1 hypothetical protein [Streptomyces morookaense]GHF05504.1 hypothetical protein GCM10010359_03090 [Streptomyces morookaense]
MAAAVVLGTVTAVPAAAHPRDSGQLQCHGTESVRYEPGVTLLARHIHVTVDGRFGSCTGGDGAVKSGGYHDEFTIDAACNDLLEGFRARRNYDWNTGDSSDAEIAGGSTAVLGQVITPITGTVTHGRFQGRKLLQLVPIPQAGALRCLGDGLTSASGPTVLTIY